MKFDANKMDISRMDAVFEEWQKRNAIFLRANMIEKIKKEVRLSFEFIKQNPNGTNYRFFYYSEYPMGAEHSKSIHCNDGEYCLMQYDFNGKPPLKKKELSDDRFVWDFIDFYHEMELAKQDMATV